MDVLPTPIALLREAREIGLEEGLKYIYPGNVFDSGGQDTVCPECGRVLTRRRGFIFSHNWVKDGRCPDCGEPIAGVGMTSEQKE
jgi:pyruvate formate lyase activating enzyme